MKKEIEISTVDDFVIYGTLDSNKNNNLVIFVHGITGNKNEHHYFNAVPFFLQKNFDTFRFTLYPRKKKGRPLSESSITTHVNDLNSVIDFFKNKYEKLILVGHSLGALVILNSNLKNISKLVLWDPTSKLVALNDKNITFNSNLDKYILNWGMEIIVGKQMIKEWKNTDLDKLTKKISIPCKIIFAEKSDKLKLWKSYLRNISIENEYVVVDNATHGFVEDGTEEELFKETLRWIE